MSGTIVGDEYWPAGFWWRALAVLLDAVVLGLLQAVLSHYTGTTPQLTSPGIPVAYTTWDFHANQFHRGGTLFGESYLINLLYFTLFESSSWRATPGKMACGLKVVGLDGGRISFLRALGRNLGKIISAMILFIGYMMAGWTRRKQALHDLMAGTLVVRRHAPAAGPLVLRE
jgi:uncharacterized RDD family membrane protein YckC